MAGPGNNGAVPVSVYYKNQNDDSCVETFTYIPPFLLELLANVAIGEWTITGVKVRG